MSVSVPCYTCDHCCFKTLLTLNTGKVQLGVTAVGIIKLPVIVFDSRCSLAPFTNLPRLLLHET
jgi:hypothetical protein